MVVKALNGQSLPDIALQYTGMAQTAIEIARANRIDITDCLSPGTEIIIPDDIATNRNITGYYANKNITPATAVNNDLEPARIFEIELPEQFS
jgi:hypothetical protein